MPTAFTRLLVLCLLAYGWVVHGYLGWNPESHLTLTYAIVDGHTLSIDAYAAQLGDRAMVGEHYYTDKLPFQSFMAVPVYAALRTLIQPVAGITPDTATLFVRYLLTWVVVGVPGALGVALLWNETRRLGATPATATLVGLAYGLGSLLWPFSNVYFSHALAATCTLATWIFARRGQTRALVPAAIGMMCEAPAIVPIAPAILIGAAVWWRQRRPIRWWPLLGSVTLAAIPILLTAAYATAVYGAPWKLGYEHLAGPEVFRDGMSAGVMGVSLPRLHILWAMLFEPYRGLIVGNPIVLVVVPAAVVAVRRRWWWELAMLTTFFGFVVLMSGYAFWNGGGSLGPRHVISALPLAFLASGRLFRGAAAHFLTATSVVMMLFAVGAGSIFPERVVNPWAEIIFPVALGEPPVSPNWTWLSLLANIHMPVANLVMLGLIALVWPCPSPQMGVRVLRAASRHGRQNGGWKSAQCDYLLEKEPSSLR